VSPEFRRGTVHLGLDVKLHEAPPSYVLDGASEFLERETGFEPATLSLGTQRSARGSAYLRLVCG